MKNKILDKRNISNNRFQVSSNNRITEDKFFVTSTLCGLFG